MKNLKKTLALVAALTMTAAVFAGCTSEGGNEPADTTAAGGRRTKMLKDLVIRNRSYRRRSAHNARLERRTYQLGKRLLLQGW